MITQMINPAKRPVANHFIVTKPRATYLQSYESVVVKIDEAGAVTLYPDWDYSKTTMRYVSQFLEDMTGDKMNAKLIRAKISVNEFSLSSDEVEL